MSSLTELQGAAFLLLSLIYSSIFNKRAIIFNSKLYPNTYRWDYPILKEHCKAFEVTNVVDILRKYGNPSKCFIYTNTNDKLILEKDTQPFEAFLILNPTLAKHFVREEMKRIIQSFIPREKQCIL